MENDVLNLKTLMEKLDVAEKVLSSKKQEFDEENFQLIMAISSMKTMIAETKEKITKKAKEEFKETGNKKMFGGIGIMEKKSIDYDEIKAFEFAKEKGMFLVLDKKSFEKAAPSLHLDFVKIDKYVFVTFPKEIKID